MNRRQLMLATAGCALSVLPFAFDTKAGAQDAPPTLPFSQAEVTRLARDLANKPFERPSSVSDGFGRLGYDQYRDIEFRSELGIWSDEERGFVMELLHAGFIYKTPVDVFIVENGRATPVTYSSHLFKFGKDQKVTPIRGERLFSGLRLKAPLGSPGRGQEFNVFQGASYFRAVGSHQVYGISARGLAIDTAQPQGEEFPFFRTFWVEQPNVGDKSVVIHALLDSPRVTGAYRFRITPGASTLMEVEVSLFARDQIEFLGIAPLTSMYLFDSLEAPRFTDFRPAVFDSNVLAIATRDGEWTVRPLANPTTLQVSAFAGRNIRGFGLQQRQREYSVFKDLEARYDLRPSLWVEPKGNWGEGHVELVEIPSDREANDNIVAFWRPSKVLSRGDTLSLAYWLRWGPPVIDETLAIVADTRSGLTLDRSRRLFVVDFAAPKGDLSPAGFPTPNFFDGKLKVNVSSSRGSVKNIVGQQNRVTGGYRVSFELDVSAIDLTELRLELLREDAPISETWLYRWTK